MQHFPQPNVAYAILLTNTVDCSLIHQSIVVAALGFSSDESVLLEIDKTIRKN